MGKPIVEAEAEVEKSAWVCEHYAAHAAAYLAPERVEAKAAETVGASAHLTISKFRRIGQLRDP